MTADQEKKSSTIIDKINEALNRVGIDLETACDIEGEGGKVKCVVVAPSLKRSVKEMGESQRDQVVMVRVDDQTSKSLDAWVATGAVKSRSEAAALFIREGMKVRASELEKLREALDDVDAARQRLREKAREVFGEGGEEQTSSAKQAGPEPGAATRGGPAESH